MNNPNDGLRLKKIRSVVPQVVMKPHFRVNDEKTYIGLINTIENGDTIKMYFLQKFKVISCDEKGYTIETETIDSEVYYMLTKNGYGYNCNHVTFWAKNGHGHTCDHVTFLVRR